MGLGRSGFYAIDLDSALDLSELISQLPDWALRFEMIPTRMSLGESVSATEFIRIGDAGLLEHNRGRWRAVGCVSFDSVVAERYNFASAVDCQSGKVVDHRVVADPNR